MGWGIGIGIGWPAAGSRSDGNVPVNTVAPTISGTATIGQTLTSTTGTWTSDTGITGYLYQWYRGATPITSATNSTYVLALADVAFDITCRVAATDTDGTSAYVSSSNSIFLFDADYQAVLNRGTALSYTLPTLAQQKLQNTLLMSMKADGVWGKLDVFYNFANNGSASFGTLNWKNPSANLATLENAPAFTSNVGFTGSAGSFINTNFSGSNGTQYSLNNASRYVYMYTASGTNPIDGLLSSNGNSIRITSSNVQQINQGTLNVDSNFQYNTTRGMKSIHRTSATDVQLFNGTVSASRVAVSSTRATQNQIILRAGSAQGLHTVSMYAMGASMISENAAFVADYNTYINAI